MTKPLPYEEWEKNYIATQCSVSEEEIEEMKTKYYCGLNTYFEFKRLLRSEYEHYLRTLEEPAHDGSAKTTGLLE
jgi:hypothetical protein